MSHGECVSAAGDWGRGNASLYFWSCSHDQDGNLACIYGKTVSLYQRQGGVGMGGEGGGEELQLVRQCAMYVVHLVRNTTPNLHQ